MVSNNDSIIVDLLNAGRLVVDKESGEVFATKSNTPQKPLGALTAKGYLRAAVNVNGKSKTIMMHRVVCIYTYGIPKESEAQVNHRNGIKTDNRPSNIEWATQISNMEHAKSNSLLKPAKHERHYNAHLSASQVTEIRNSNKSTRDLSLQYGVSMAQIRRIITNKRWTNDVQNRSDNPQ